MAELTTFARPYAKAAYLYAQEQGVLTDWESMLGLVAQLVVEPAVEHHLGRPELSAGDRVNALATLCGDALTPAGKNFLTQLAENHRLALLPEIHDLFKIMLADAEQKVDVELVSAFALDDAATAKIVDSLKARFGRDVRVNTKVDESLIGGVLVRTGDTVIDGSVRGRLARLAEQLNS